ncbi:MAG: branched-chain amino acid ABC transporter permease [Desulfobacteraceae bacterium]|jgi:branched-chain amino acid transport system permease protein
MIGSTAKKVAGFALLICILPYLFSLSSKTAYYTDVMVFVAIHSIICAGLSLLLGYTGQISLGQAAFYGVGAYGSGILTTQVQLNPWLAMIAGAVIAALLAVIIGVPSLKLKGHYLAMATLGFGMIAFIFLNECIILTGGPSGFGSIPPLSIAHFELSSTMAFYYFSWFVAVVVLVISLNIVNSRPGRALKAIHGSERAAAAMGIDIARAKVEIFVVSGIFGALAGSLYAHFVTFINPPPFNVFFSLKVLMMVAIGGIGSIWGAFLGAALLTFLPEWLSSLQDFDVLAYGVILLLIVMYCPEGIVGLLTKAGTYFSNQFGKGRN